MKQKLVLLSIFFLVPTFFACEKESNDQNNTNDKKIAKAPIMGPVVYSTWFDWENINTINTAYGIPVDMPWGFGVDACIPTSMKHNHPKSDGWEMLYNTLDRNTGTTSTFFALYNKYLGVIHMFYTCLYDLESAEAYYEAYNITGSSSLLNFEGKKNLVSNQKDFYPTVVKGPEGFVNKIYNTSNSTFEYRLIPDKSFAVRTWYGTEIEISYEDLSNLNDMDFYLQYLPFRGNTSTVKLTGNVEGTIKGTIEAKSIGNTNLIGSLGTLISNASNSNQVNVDGSTVVGTIIDNVAKAKNSATPSFFNGLWSKIQTAIPTAAQGAIVSSLSSAVSTGIKWATNPLNAFVSSIFSIGGGSSSVPLNKVDLKIDAEIKLEGSIESQTMITSIDLALPNTIFNRGGNGYPTFIMKDWNLGVWNVESLPVVNYNINNIYYKINGRVVLEPRIGSVTITLPLASLAKINVNPKVENDCYVTERKIEYIIETDDAENKSDLDNYWEPFGFRVSANNTYIQSYYFADNGTGFCRPYHLNYTCGFNLYARATLILCNKSNGKEYVHIKDFPLQVKINKTTTYLNYVEGGSGLQ